MTKRVRTEYNKAWYILNKDKHRANVKEAHQRNKKEVIDHYGGKCTCCGETILDFLALDHINNDGNEHRRETKRSGTGFHKWVKKMEYPTIFQILCHNCNFSKHLNHGTCIHQLMKQNVEVDETL